MKYFIPTLALGTLLPAQVSPEDKLGGVPWGFPDERWPKCDTCKLEMSFLAQVAHALPRLDLGAQGRVLYAFLWNSDECPAYAANSGANACLIVGKAELTNSLSAEHGTIYPEARITGWAEKEDGVPEARFWDYLSDAFSADIEPNAEETKLGSVPHLYQGQVGLPGKPWRYVMQIFSEYEFKGKPPTADAAGCVVRRTGANGEWIDEKPSKAKKGAPGVVWVLDEGFMCDPLIFGLETLTYLFVNTRGAKPAGCMMSQMT